MDSSFQPVFDFRNDISPSYIEPMFLQLEANLWYDYKELKELLRESRLDVEGSQIVGNNALAWSLLGLVDSREEKNRGRTKMIQISPLGEYLQETYSTNHELFYDLFHFLFYSAWRRAHDLKRARFWLYATVCDSLWHEAPNQMDAIKLTNRLQSDCKAAFPEYNPSFPERSVRSVFPWLVALTPPFLQKCGNRSLLCSVRREYCTPQLFHLATDLIFTSEGLQYGTAMAMGDKNIEAISRVCLLAPDRFWAMADLTQMTIRGFNLQRGQWGSGIVLSGPPDWIDLPDYSQTDDIDEYDEDLDEEA